MGLDTVSTGSGSDLTVSKMILTFEAKLSLEL
jgi:hypothetical protein